MLLEFIMDLKIMDVMQIHMTPYHFDKDNFLANSLQIRVSNQILQLS